MRLETCQSGGNHTHRATLVGALDGKLDGAIDQREQSVVATDADAEPGLVRAWPEPIFEIGRDLWIVTHADLRRTARVRAFIEMTVAFLVAHRAQLAGELLSPASR